MTNRNLSTKRTKNPRSKKLIFISCEGVVTEEIYFKILKEKIFSNIGERINIISVREDFNNIPKDERTQQQIDEQNKSQPRDVMNRMDNFKEKDKNKYDFQIEDEFWLIIDIDDHTSIDKITEFEYVINESKNKGYQLAISNPYFEFWLYLHHCDIKTEDEKYAVTDTQSYIKNIYFRKQMGDVKITMSGNGKKEPKPEDYTCEKVALAVKRAEILHIDKNENYPKNLGSHVYLLINKFIELENEKNVDNQNIK